MKVQPYLFFDGRCEEALEFYKEKLGAEVGDLMRFSEAPPMPQSDAGCEMAPGSENKILHADFKIGETALMASDGMNSGNPNFEGISLALSLASMEETERLFNALSEDGQIQMPLGPTFFSPSFGMVTDKFGVSWMIMAEK